jgi:hypothetical protein
MPADSESPAAPHSYPGLYFLQLSKFRKFFFFSNLITVSYIFEQILNINHNITAELISVGVFTTVEYLLL